MQNYLAFIDVAHNKRHAPRVPFEVRKGQFKGELSCKNKLLLKNSLVFEKFDGTLVASQSDFVKEKSHFECSQMTMCARFDVTGGWPDRFVLENSRIARLNFLHQLLDWRQHLNVHLH